jgi:hypothetical protein
LPILHQTLPPAIVVVTMPEEANTTTMFSAVKESAADSQPGLSAAALGVMCPTGVSENTRLRAVVLPGHLSNLIAA